MSSAEETRHGTAVQAREEGGPSVVPERAGIGPSPLPGWRTQVSDPHFPTAPGDPPKGVIGIVVAQKFPEPEIIRLRIEEGIERVSPDTVWVMRDAERQSHAATYAWQTFRSHGIVPFLAPLVPVWKSKGVEAVNPQTGEDETIGAHDLRATWRDAEMRATCERIIVFHDKSSGVTAEWLDYCESRKEYPSEGKHCVAKIYVVERGKKKVTRRKSRKPVGVR